MDISQLIEKFENCTLPKSQWTHEARLRVAFYYLSTNNFPVGLRIIRSGIIKYNKKLREINWAPNIYHETITVFWCIKVQEFIDLFINESIATREKILLRSELTDKALIKKFYRKELLDDPQNQLYFLPTKEIRLISYMK
jgi:hypothetical protein